MDILIYSIDLFYNNTKKLAIINLFFYTCFFNYCYSDRICYFDTFSIDTILNWTRPAQLAEHKPYLKFELKILDSILNYIQLSRHRNK